MTVSELEQAGLVLFGKGWRSAMAEELDVDKSTIRRWMASDSIPKIVELAVDGLHARGVLTNDSIANHAA